MRQTGPTGLQTHFNAFLDFLSSNRDTSAVLVTPFQALQVVALPLFALRRLFSHFSPDLEVWWHEYWHFVFLRLALRRVLHGLGPAVVYAQCPVSAKAALAARTGPEQNVVMAVHFNISQADEWVIQKGIKPGGTVFRQIKRREAEVLPRLDGIVYLSSFMKSQVEESIPDARSVASTVLPNFVPDEGNQPGSEGSAELITIGYLGARKNQSFLLRVLQAAKRRGREYRLSIVGDGPDRARLENLARELDVGSQVTFIRSDGGARRWLPSHRVYVHSALLENFPLVIVEALAAGLPVCAAPVGGIPDAYEDGVEGLYWDLDDPNGAAEKLVGLLEDEELYSRMALAARRRFVDNYRTEVVAERLLNFLLQQEGSKAPVRSRQ